MRLLEGVGPRPALSTLTRPNRAVVVKPGLVQRRVFSPSPKLPQRPEDISPVIPGISTGDMPVVLSDYVDLATGATKTFDAGKLGSYTISEDGTVLLGPPTVFNSENIDDFDF